MTHHEPHHTGAEPGHERSDIRFRVVGALTIGIVALGLVGVVSSYLLFGYFSARATRADRPPSPVGDARPTPPGPRLQTDPYSDYARLRADEEAMLHSYDWVDRDLGLVRIPVERAMAVLAERGLPTPTPAPTPTPEPTPARTGRGARR
jgi:hypothetical protein